MFEQHSYTEDYNNPYKFNGKELDEETGFYYYGARYYDPKISLWLSIDPLAEKFPSWSPYNYCMQNPLNLIDPTGMGPEDTDTDPPVKGTKNTTSWGEKVTWDGRNWIDECGGRVMLNEKEIEEIHISNSKNKSNTPPDEPKEEDRYQKIYKFKRDGRYSPSTDWRIAASICALPLTVYAAAEYGVAYGISLFEMPTWGTFGAKAGVDFTTELFANKGNIGDVNAISVIGAGFGADALASPFSLTWNKGLRFNTFEQTIVNYGTNKFNGKLKSGVNYLNNKPLFQNGFSKVYFNSVIIGTESFTKNTTNDLFPKE